MNEIEKVINKLNDTLDNVVGKDGVKADITANIAPSTYLYLGATIVGSILIGSLVVSVFKK